MDPPTFGKIRYSSQTSFFAMNEVAIFVYGREGKRFLASQGFNACHGVYLVSTIATVAAHIPPNPSLESKDPQAGDKNLVLKMQQFAQAYLQNRQFFQNYKVALLYARFDGKVALPDQKAFIEQCLRRFKVDFPIQDYHVKLPGEPRGEEHGTAFVDGRATNGAVLYAEDKPILRVYNSPSQKVDRLSHPQVVSYSNAVFPRQATSELRTSLPQDVRYTNPIFPRPDTSESTANLSNETRVSNSVPAPEVISKLVAGTSGKEKAETKKLKYVKSSIVNMKKGDREVELKTGKVLIPAEHWKKASVNNKQFWVCEKYLLYTDL
ncbi:uncharacterized protein PV06_10631 [Exophiala oligosperma]|uniref:Uncharacterized protein n=1 Tax=Exophiala oligosperma TaxID=215243 RepID=A0A0D2D4N1_9EURO|nr:uncharacterized protein PV06_10631 [Exophiala oligosperma]KIW37290.1 hypothetical protein PV06_10631 [Exophiala oligosperma]